MSGFDFDDAVLRASFEVDTLDDPNFPLSGLGLGAEYLYSLTDLGADDKYQRLEAAGSYCLLPGGFADCFCLANDSIASLGADGGFCRH